MKPCSRKTPQDLLKRYHPDSMARLVIRTNKAGLKDPETGVNRSLSKSVPERQRLIRWFNFWLDIANDSVFLQVCALDIFATDLNALIILIRFAHAVHS